MSDPREDLEFQARYREDASAPDDAAVAAIAGGVREIDALRASLTEMYEAAISGNFYEDYDEATARCRRARQALHRYPTEGNHHA